MGAANAKLDNLLSSSMSLLGLNRFQSEKDKLVYILSREETNVLNVRSLSTFVLVVSVLGAAFPAEAAPGKDINAIRAECFRQANEAAAASGANMGGGATGARNAAGYSAYRACARKNGIRP